ncbi:MAG: hypothetical protein BSOLF_2782 [Candidatus Carbobacillus altaicus]|uniref:Uncharacterized protein n=1 Tax=Candidatus Carbonibacillus altaicus TaxID=2163959 RepID=A0A2R6XXW1_9BACL|nr:MAG: hypothetical protein BSOLF_2782 [Candidatus Carbobacillus altaicus]
MHRGIDRMDRSALIDEQDMAADGRLKRNRTFHLFLKIICHLHRRPDEKMRQEKFGALSMAPKDKSIRRDRSRRLRGSDFANKSPLDDQFHVAFKASSTITEACTSPFRREKDNLVDMAARPAVARIEIFFIHAPQRIGAPVRRHDHPGKIERRNHRTIVFCHAKCGPCRHSRCAFDFTLVDNRPEGRTETLQMEKVGIHRHDRLG